MQTSNSRLQTSYRRSITIKSPLKSTARPKTSETTTIVFHRQRVCRRRTITLRIETITKSMSAKDREHFQFGVSAAKRHHPKGLHLERGADLVAGVLGDDDLIGLRDA